MIVRPALQADMPDLIAMASKFYESTAYRDFAPFSLLSASVVLELLLKDGVLLVAESEGDVVGMVGLHVGPFYFNTDKISAHEVFWWVNPEHRDTGAGLALMRALEPACREKGADMIQMGYLSSSPPAAKLIYERLGFQHSETSYIKVL